MCREANLKQDREDIKGVDLLMYSFQVLDCSWGRVGLHVDAGAREQNGGSVKFAGCGYGIVPAIDGVFINESLLVRHLIPQVW